MGQRILSELMVFNAHPFTGEGVSVYGTIGDEVQYRKLRILRKSRYSRPRRHVIKGSDGNFDLAADSVPKTARLGSVASSASSITADIPVEFASQNVTWDVRRFKDDVENLIDNELTIRTKLDANRDEDVEILGTAEVLTQEQRAGGIVRMRFIYNASHEGVNPVTFEAIATAGPSSPDTVSIPFRSSQNEYTIDTPALLDTAPYTYTLRAINGAATKDLAAGFQVVADASGPPVPTNISAEVI